MKFKEETQFLKLVVVNHLIRERWKQRDLDSKYINVTNLNLCHICLLREYSVLIKKNHSHN